MYLSIEENPNCDWIDGRVWQERSERRPVTHVLRRRQGQDVWCEIIAVGEEFQLLPAQALKVEDSGEGLCYLVRGSNWGLRLKDSSCRDPWSLEDVHQWGEPFLLLSADGLDLRFGT